MAVGLAFLIVVGAIALSVVGGSVIGHWIADNPDDGEDFGVLIGTALLVLIPPIAYLAVTWNNPA